MLGCAGAPAQQAPNALPAEVQAALPEARLGGSGRLTVWGFQAYDASLWVAPGFRGEAYARHAFALELSYLRDFSNSAIATRSIEEMRRAGPLDDARAAQWQQALRGAFPDVRKGDRVMGVNRPGEGVLFLTNGRASGEIRDAEFARLFFGIWLAPHTSEPQLRRALLAQTQ